MTQLPPPSGIPLLHKLIAAALAIAVGLGVYLYFIRPSAEVLNARKYGAAGITWAVRDPQVSERRGYFDLRADFSPLRRYDGQDGSVQIASIVRSLCADVVAHPFAEVERDKIYRVTINILQNGKPVLPRPVPVPVIDGACATAPGAMVIYPRLPPPLIHWKIVRMIQDGEGWLVANFQPAESAGRSGEEFPFLLACTDLLADPYLNERVPMGQVGKVRIVQDARKSLGIFRFGKLFKAEFVVEPDGSCAPFAAGKEP